MRMQSSGDSSRRGGGAMPTEASTLAAAITMGISIAWIVAVLASHASHGQPHSIGYG